MVHGLGPKEDLVLISWDIWTGKWALNLSQSELNVNVDFFLFSKYYKVKEIFYNLTKVYNSKY